MPAALLLTFRLRPWLLPPFLQALPGIIMWRHTLANKLYVTCRAAKQCQDNLICASAGICAAERGVWRHIYAVQAGRGGRLGGRQGGRCAVRGRDRACKICGTRPLTSACVSFLDCGCKRSSDKRFLGLVCSPVLFQEGAHCSDGAAGHLPSCLLSDWGLCVLAGCAMPEMCYA